jgi:hypothetical protein
MKSSNNSEMHGRDVQGLGFDMERGFCRIIISATARDRPMYNHRSAMEWDSSMSAGHAIKDFSQETFSTQRTSRKTKAMA